MEIAVSHCYDDESFGKNCEHKSGETSPEGFRVSIYKTWLHFYNPSQKEYPEEMMTPGFYERGDLKVIIHKDKKNSLYVAVWFVNEEGGVEGFVGIGFFREDEYSDYDHEEFIEFLSRPDIPESLKEKVFTKLITDL